METKEEILEAMISRLAQLLGKDVAAFGENTPFEELGMKSVNYSQLTTYLEDCCDVEIPYMDFKRKKTLGEAAKYIIDLIEG